MTEPLQNTEMLSEELPAQSEYNSIAGIVDPDNVLVSRVHNGDIAAFGELVERHQRGVYGIVSRMVTGRDDVDDLVQDIFVAAYGAIGSFRKDAKFSTWLHAIAVNTTLKRLKKMKRQSAVSIDDPISGLAATIRSESDPSPDSSIEEKERRLAVRKAIDSLPDKQRIVVVMHYFEQYSCDEIAAILKCSVGTVWSRLHYACKKLSSELRWMEQG